MGFTLRTAFGKVPLEPGALERELEAARDVEDAFVILERDQDGAFVQFNGEALEFGDGDELHRLDTLELAQEAFARFQAGEDLGAAPGWRRVTHELAEARRERWRNRLFGLVVLAVAAAIMVYGWQKLQGAIGP